MMKMHRLLVQAILKRGVKKGEFYFCLLGCFMPAFWDLKAHVNIYNALLF
jgi:hypothetical protein